MAVQLITETLVTPGNKLQISGIIPEDAHHIQVGLGSSWKDLSFFMDVRFLCDDQLVFNTREDGKWGEEIIKPNPFKRGGRLQVTVNYTGPHYVVMLPGQDRVDFINRASVKTSQIMVKGDLELLEFTLKPSN